MAKEYKFNPSTGEFEEKKEVNSGCSIKLLDIVICLIVFIIIKKACN
jgi:hypothetical protein